MLNLADLERVLVVTAHPDDVDFGAAGTVATLTAGGTSVSYCICTDGDAGGFDPAVPRSEIGGIRRAEQRAAAAAVGVTDVVFLGYRDGQLVADQALRRDVSREIRRVRPQVVLTQSPERRWDRLGASHPDHLAAGEAATCAVYPDARNPFAHPSLMDEGFEAWTVPELWLMASATGAFTLDVTDTLPAKLAALASHASQFPDGFGVVEERVRQWMSATAAAAGLAEGRVAETFQRVEIG